MNDVRVLIVGRDQLGRAGLAALLDQQPGLVSVGQVSEDADLSAALDAFRPDVMVWDLGWDPASAIEQLSGLPNDSRPVMALLPDESRAAETWTAGARGLLLRDVDAGRLASALTALANGLVVVDPQLAAAVPVLRDRPTGPVPDLTPREMEALRLLAQGLPNKVIASRLGISEHTVKFHVNSIMGKLGAQSRTEAVTRATRLGLIFL